MNKNDRSTNRELKGIELTDSELKLAEIFITLYPSLLDDDLKSRDLILNEEVDRLLNRLGYECKYLFIRDAVIYGVVDSEYFFKYHIHNPDHLRLVLEQIALIDLEIETLTKTYNQTAESKADERIYMFQLDSLENKKKGFIVQFAELYTANTFRYFNWN